MKVLIVSHSDISGGAGRASFRLHQAFRNHDIDASLIVREKISKDDTVRCDQSISAKLAARIRSRFEDRIQRLKAFETSGFASLNLLPTWWSRRINADDADVVNLHWFGSGALSIRDVAGIEHPVVMTLHDMWGFCGAEHYAPDHESARWRVGYTSGNRGEQSRGIDINRWVWQSKRRHWRPVRVVCPSRWLAECARSSALMREWPVHVIPNVLDLETFRPLDRQKAREILDLPQAKKIILFGAEGQHADKRKGFDLLIEALHRIDDPQREFVGVIFGQNKPRDISPGEIPFHWLGHLKDDSILRSLYSAADVVVVPSRQEAFGQVASESQACGTPVVAFDTTGLRDVVEHRRTGYLADAFSADDLARGISWILEDKHRRVAMGHDARQRAVNNWRSSVVVAQYRDIYRLALEDHNRRV